MLLTLVMVWRIHGLAAWWMWGHHIPMRVHHTTTWRPAHHLVALAPLLMLLHLLLHLLAHHEIVLRIHSLWRTSHACK